LIWELASRINARLAQVSEERVDLFFDEISNFTEGLDISTEGIRNVPLDKAAVELLWKRAGHPCFHLYDNIHLAQRHVLEALRPVALKRDPLLVEYIVGLGRNPSEWMCTGAEGLNAVPAVMVR
jgi:hypothetical protein